MSRRFFLIAGEASGDALGAALMAGLRRLVPGVEFAGVGGPLMQGEGLESLFDMNELSVMGIAEVLPKYRHLKRRIAETAAAAQAYGPDAVITIDSPDFCLRVAKILRAQSDIRVVHYVAPSVWAWRPKRAAKMAAHVDQVLALLPFEPPYLEAAGVRCDFVGHPVAAMDPASPQEVAAFTARHGIDGPLLTVLPGSRRGEVRRLAPIFGPALRDLAAAVPGLRIALPVAPAVADILPELIGDWPGDPVLIPADKPHEKWAAFGASQGALAASGTVSLELARAGCPMVIAYDMNWLSRRIISAMLRIDTVTLVNLVSETRVVPEFIGAACQPGPIGAALVEMMRGGAGDQRAAMALAMERLGAGGEAPGLRAARAVLDGLDAP